MTEGVATPNDADAAAQRAAEQARLRKERREAKIKAGGSARLNKIMGNGGRPPVPEFEASAPAAATAAAATAAEPTPVASVTPDVPDPGDIDISEHHYTPKSTPRRGNGAGGGREPPLAAPMTGDSGLSEAALRQMMLGFDPASANSNSGFPGQNPAGGAGGGDAEDPIMKMMSQMLSGAGGAGNGAPGTSPFPGFPNIPSIPSTQAATTAATGPDPYTSLWRLLHALVALGLGLYVAFLTPFTGTRAERERSALSSADLAEFEREKDLFFWVFATAETALLTTRFFLDKGRAPAPGIVSTVVGLVPEPYGGYVRVIMRYGQILTTVRSDILACMFVLGACSWLRA
ncbi:hypothetical protein N3K66_002659 [Trichothecium roseum]|uniref:Uncharacterized protein n=1 Tax=Trichothecium roseum TaxID=47278 RepID=A0ACC0VBN8_9HYPO|nr:hypothetical protein N3K66_002659 [Trichothecium roseum]